MISKEKSCKVEVKIEQLKQKMRSLPLINIKLRSRRKPNTILPDHQQTLFKKEEKHAQLFMINQDQNIEHH